jgi:FkbH-like protein
MSNELYRDLAWLPRPPKDLRERFRSLDVGAESFVADIRALANTALDLNGLTRLAGVMGRAKDAGRTLAPLIPLRLGIIGHGTLDLLLPALVAAGVRHGFALEVVAGEYDQVLQSAIQPNSTVNLATPDVVLLSLDWRSLPLQPVPGDAAAAASTVAGAADLVDQIRTALVGHHGAVCIVPTIVPPPEALFGSLDRALPGTTRWLIEELNREICKRVAAGTDLVFDVAGLAETVGIASWQSAQQWNLAKLPFDEAFIPLYADHVCRILGAMRGRSRKVLVLDLDNTVWGGVIGDDGLAGIALAQGDAIGEAHLAVQRMALELRSRGVVLAVCSKNTDEVAREVFRKHPEMLLREKHIAVFQANWRDKATNLQAIAAELSLGIDSLVFLDDNPVERGLIRQMLPEVATPEVGTDPADFARTLAAAGYFELIGFSEEDRKRADFYDTNARRAELRSQAGDLEGYLKSLQMEISFAPFDATGRARIVQLINKSNQFNLTTRRYTAVEIQQIENDPRCFSLQVRLTDLYGDNGMISVIICRPGESGDWEIDTWLMSCRVLGRGVERMVLHEIVTAARNGSIKSLLGRYLPTAKNGLVKDHYAELGFTLVESQPDGTSSWRLETDVEITTPPMTVHRLAQSDIPETETATE